MTDPYRHTDRLITRQPDGRTNRQTELRKTRSIGESGFISLVDVG